MKRSIPIVYIYVFLLCINAICYFGSLYSGFVGDFSGGMWRLDTHKYWDFISCYGFPAHEQVSMWFFGTMYQLFGKQHIAWGCMQIALHTINGVLVYKITQLLLQQSTKYPSSIDMVLFPLFSSLLFCLMPYQAEVVHYKVCYNYLLTCSFLLCFVIRIIKVYQGKVSSLWIDLFIINLCYYTFEISLILPIFIIVVLIFSKLILKNRDLAHYLFQLLLLSAISFGVYFIFTYVKLGVWFGHYGGDIHGNWKPQLILSTIAKNILKIISLSRYTLSSQQELLFQYLDNIYIVLFVFIFFSGMAWLLYTLVSTNKLLLLWGFLFFILAIVFLIPTANLYFYYLLLGQNDRYIYITLSFFSIGLVLFFYALWQHKTMIPLLIVLCIYLPYLYETNAYWRNSGKVYNNLIKSFPDINKPAVLLNLPDNFCGIMIFPTLTIQQSALSDELQYVFQRSPQHLIIDAAQYNMTSMTASILIHKDDELHYTISFRNWGSWWWLANKGAYSHESYFHSIEVHDYYYYLTIKEDCIGQVDFYYNDNESWQALQVTLPP